MVLLEHEKPDTSLSEHKAQLMAALADIDRQLEVAEAYENPIERFFKRDDLLEQRDLLEAELDSTSTPPKLG